MLDKIRYAAFIIFVCMLGGCESVSVHSDFDSGTDFSRYRTFSFISDKPLLVATVDATNPLLEERLINLTRAELTTKGFRYTDDRETADFVVSFTLGSRDKLRVNSYPSTYRGAYYGGWGRPYHSEVDVRNYTEGTLAIDLFDVAKRAPVWHGWAVKSISSRDRENPEPLIQKIVTSVLAEFPPTAAGS